MLVEALWFFGAAGGWMLLVALFSYHRQRRREARATAALAAAVREHRHQPSTLHPVIDAERCIGCGSCTSACPEGEVLGIVNGTSTLIDAASCIGHGRCATECPMQAIRLVLGTSERGLDLPALNEGFESSRPGVHVIGELGGMGLIKNALRQGVELIEVVAARLCGAAEGCGADLVVVGAGPAGLAAAVAARARGLSFRVLEQGSLGGTIASYPRQKLVLTEPLRLPLYGRFGRPTMSKEELMSDLARLCAKAGVEVELGVVVEGIEGEDGRFVLATNKGPVRARKVVLATGRRGTPRRLGVPGEELPKVTYELVDPEQYAGKRVLVVGGGDSALEAAVMLAGTAGVEVTLSYRGAALTRARRANLERLEALVRTGRVDVLLESHVTGIDASTVSLTCRQEAKPLVVANDFVIVCAGGELPLTFLSRVGVAVRRHVGSEPVAMVRPAGRALALRRLMSLLRPGIVLPLLGALAIGTLAYLGRDYYPLPRLERLRSPLHEVLRPSGIVGHGLGVLAGVLLLSAFVYPVRKRWRAIKGRGALRPWLTQHVFVGLMAPALVAFHAAFVAKNLIATATYSSLLVVCATGIFGRYLYRLVPSARGNTAGVEATFAQLARRRRALEELLAPVAGDPRARPLLRAIAQTELPDRPLIVYGLLSCLEIVRRWRILWRARALFPEEGARARFCRNFMQFHRLRTQARYGRSLRRLFNAWHSVHVSLSVLLLAVMAIHVALAAYLGYAWILM